MVFTQVRKQSATATRVPASGTDSQSRSPPKSYKYSGGRTLTILDPSTVAKKGVKSKFGMAVGKGTKLGGVKNKASKGLPSEVTEGIVVKIGKEIVDVSKTLPSDSLLSWSPTLDFSDLNRNHDTSSSNSIHYPLSPNERSEFALKNGKKVSEFQWKVYDVTRRIPVGKVATYQVVAEMVVAAGNGEKASMGEMDMGGETESKPKSASGCARAVGTALRNNPFAPYVPCHRVISSDLYIGGFMGEYIRSGTGTKSDPSQGKSMEKTKKKLEMLGLEGIAFEERGYLKDGKLSKRIWKGDC